MQLLLATNNAHKKIELSALWPGHSVLLPLDVGLDRWDHEETESTFLGNALGKAHSLFRAVQGAFPVVADDSGICVDALEGGPGVFSARFGSIETGRPLSDSEKNDLLLERLAGRKDRNAHFVCALALVLSKDRELVVQETWEGEIASSSRGVNGFGYDPIFYLPHLAVVSAELSPDEKNRLSHRGRASRRLAVLLDDLTINP